MDLERLKVYLQSQNFLVKNGQNVRTQNLDSTEFIKMGFSLDQVGNSVFGSSW
jgi:hypothetical protein